MMSIERPSRQTPMKDQSTEGLMHPWFTTIVAILVTAFLVVGIIFALYTARESQTIATSAVSEDFFKQPTLVSGLIVMASVLVSLGNRNVSISERARNACRVVYEARKSGESDVVWNAQSQITVFRNRYLFNTWAMALLLLGLALLAVMYAFAAHEKLFYARSCFYISCLLGVLACLLTLFDIYLGWVTLRTEMEFCSNYDTSGYKSEASISNRLKVKRYCNQQYDRIVYRFKEELEDRAQKLLANDSLKSMARERMAVSFWRRFWNQQYEQFTYWAEGWIDRETFKFWIEQRRLDFESNESVLGKTFCEAWKSHGTTICREQIFLGLYDDLMTKDPETALGNAEGGLAKRRREEKVKH
jgi:hypothetical protein